MQTQTTPPGSVHPAVYRTPEQWAGDESLTGSSPRSHPPLLSREPFPVEDQQKPGEKIPEPYQRRYCSCGQKVRVRYLRSRQWAPVFTLAPPSPGNEIESCPHCRARLDIDSLR